MKETKNNTCAICGEHIDKSSCSSSWTTMIMSKMITDADNERGYDIHKGMRITLCGCCAIKVWDSVRSGLNNKDVQSKGC